MEQLKKAEVVGASSLLRIAQYQLLGFGANSMLVDDVIDKPARMDFMSHIPQAQQSRVVGHELNIEKRHMSCKRLAKLSFVVLP